MMHLLIVSYCSSGHAALIINRCVEQYLIIFFDFAFSLDELLDGGLYTGELTEIVGSAGVGKSQVIHIKES